MTNLFILHVIIYTKIIQATTYFLKNDSSFLHFAAAAERQASASRFRRFARGILCCGFVYAIVYSDDPP